MAKKEITLFPRHKRMLAELGENIRLARLRRKLSSEQLSERANISRSTLVKLENGESNMGIANLLNVLRVLGLEEDILSIAKDDELGRKIQDAGLIVKKRAPKSR